MASTKELIALAREIRRRQQEHARKDGPYWAGRDDAFEECLGLLEPLDYEAMKLAMRGEVAHAH